MRKLDQVQINACRFLARFGSYCPGTMSGPATADLLAILDSLVRAKRATVEQTDDGPSYRLTAQGEADAS